MIIIVVTSHVTPKELLIGMPINASLLNHHAVFPQNVSSTHAADGGYYTIILEVVISGK